MLQGFPFIYHTCHSNLSMSVVKKKKKVYVLFTFLKPSPCFQVRSKTEQSSGRYMIVDLAYIIKRTQWGGMWNPEFAANLDQSGY